MAGGGDPGPLSATHTAYDPEGRVVATWGATYPVAYAYDDFGRMAAMATTRDSAHESVNLLALLPAGLTLADVSDPAYPSALDTTLWLYHEPTGLLTNKVYADGKGAAYSYTPDGKLATRTWARGITASYDYATLVRRASENTNKNRHGSNGCGSRDLFDAVT